MLFEINIYILVKKFERRTLRENNDSVKYYIYTIKKKLGEERNARSNTLYNNKFILVKSFGRGTLRELNHSV